MIALIKRERLYSDPTSIFLKEYENWHIKKRKVILNGEEYIETSKKDLKLSEILKSQNSAPLLRLLIKAWILHNVISFDEEELRKNKFFTSDVNDIILNCYQKIAISIEKNLNLSRVERKNRSEQERKNNVFSLTPNMHHLAQRVSFIKLCIGLAPFDIHKYTGTHSIWQEKIRFYLFSHLNLPISQ